LGAYLVDGAPPLLELELKGSRSQGDMPVFRRKLIIVPRMLVRKPIDRWRLSFEDEYGHVVGADTERGNLPEVFTWAGQDSRGQGVLDGEFKVTIEVWDLAGNTASASGRALLSRKAPEVALNVSRTDTDLQVGLRRDSAVPLAYWRLEMWSNEGKILKSVEGRDMPANVDVELPESGENGEIQGVLFVEDILGNTARRDIQDVFLTARKQEEKSTKDKKPVSISESWVDEF
jgi:hypothetical protein